VKAKSLRVSLFGYRQHGVRVRALSAAGGLVVHREIVDRDGAPVAEGHRFVITHERTGHLASRFYKTQRDATAAMRRIAKLTDWSKVTVKNAGSIPRDVLDAIRDEERR
jgi:hypothetical protein